MKTVEELEVYSLALELVKDIYTITKPFPREELFGITSQMRRCVVSIPTNISEGFYRISTRDYLRFLNIAYSSSSELSTLLQISQQLNILTNDLYNQTISKVIIIRKMINNLSKALKKRCS